MNADFIPVDQAAVGEHRHRMLHHRLVPAVDHLRRQRGGIVDQRGQRIAEHRDRAGIDHAQSRAGRSGLKQQVVHRIEVDPPRGRRIGLCRAAGDGGEVDQRVAAARQRRSANRGVAKVADDRFCTRGKPCGLGIDPDHRLAARH
jgi:hypothetical protein